MTKSKFVITPALREIIAESSRRIFGNLPVVPYRTGNKLLVSKPTGPKLANYYPIPTIRDFKSVSPRYETAINERRQRSLAKMKRLGRGPPKKGQGKRATRGKKT